MILFFGGSLGLMSLLLSAFLYHSPVEGALNENFDALRVAIYSAQINAVLITVIGLFVLPNNLRLTKKVLNWAGISLALGTFLFCFGVLMSNFYDFQTLSRFTPIGGTFMILSWCLLMVLGLRSRG